jgi:hypothetical protein
MGPQPIAPPAGVTTGHPVDELLLTTLELERPRSGASDPHNRKPG